MQELCNQQGFVDNLFLYLWMQDPIIKQVPNIRIPDTVIYRNNRVFQWYFYNQGQIKKKSKNKLTNEHIQDIFLKNHPKCGIIAVWIKKQKYNNNKSEKLIYDYMNEQQFNAFINSPNSNEIREGVLQKFIVPKGLTNSVINIMWSQNLCFFEKIENNCKLNDTQLDIYQRTLTYEIASSNATITQLKGSYLVSTLETMAHNIQQHIANLSYNRFQITRLNLIFKIDSQDQLILIGCRQIKVNDRKFQDQQQQQMDKINEIKTDISQNIDLSRMNLQMKVSLKKDITCTSCEKDIDEFRSYEIPLKLVVKSWDFDHDGKKQVLSLDKQYRLQQRGSLNDIHSTMMDQQDHFIDVEKAYTIPKVIRNLLPKLKEDKYQVLKSNPGFLDTKVKVCEQCYLDILSSCNIHEHLHKITKKIDMQYNFNGIGKLKPEVLNERYKRTQKNIQLKALFEEHEEDPVQFMKKRQAQHHQQQSYMTAPNFTKPESKKIYNLTNKVGIKTNQRSEQFLKTLNKPFKPSEIPDNQSMKSQSTSKTSDNFNKQKSTTLSKNFSQKDINNLSQQESIMLTQSQQNQKKQLKESRTQQTPQNESYYSQKKSIKDYEKKYQKQRCSSQEDLRIQYLYQAKTDQFRRKQQQQLHHNSILKGKANLSTTVEGDLSQQ